MNKLLELKDIVLDYGRGKDLHRAVDHVNIDLKEGEIIGLVGQSGCGKTSIAKLIMGLESHQSGEMVVMGEKQDPRNKAQLRERRSHIQMIFQDPYSSLDPRMGIEAILKEPLRSLKPDMEEKAMDQRVRELLDLVGLSEDYLHALPGSMSGGQRQRVGIARAIAAYPEIVLCDEPVSALDVSVQANILNLLLDLRDRLHISMIFISHDLAVVRYIADRIYVMNKGRICEEGTTDAIFEAPKDEYTRFLLNSVYDIDG